MHQQLSHSALRRSGAIPRSDGSRHAKSRRPQRTVPAHQTSPSCRLPSPLRRALPYRRYRQRRWPRRLSVGSSRPPRRQREMVGRARRLARMVRSMPADCSTTQTITQPVRTTVSAGTIANRRGFMIVASGRSTWARLNCQACDAVEPSDHDMTAQGRKLDVIDFFEQCCWSATRRPRGPLPACLHSLQRGTKGAARTASMPA